jgi:hypothetical protein
MAQPPLATGAVDERGDPSAALLVMPNCGHTINLEDPDQVQPPDLVVQVDGARPKRDPRAMASIPATGLVGTPKSAVGHGVPP